MATAQDADFPEDQFHDNREYDISPSVATKCDLCTFEPIPVERAEDYVVEDEKLCTFFDEDDCQATFVYGYTNTTGKLVVRFILFCLMGI